MMQFSQKYAIVQLLEDVPVGYSFSSDNWPLHTTIIDTFAVNWTTEQLVSTLKDSANTYPSADTIATGEAQFGDSGQVSVVLLDRTERLVLLHEAVLADLEKGDLALNDPQFSGDGFLPHATVQKQARLEIGQAVRITALSVIDMFPGADPYQREVVSTIPLAKLD